MGPIKVVSRVEEHQHKSILVMYIEAVYLLYYIECSGCSLVIHPSLYTDKYSNLFLLYDTNTQLSQHFNCKSLYCPG